MDISTKLRLKLKITIRSFVFFKSNFVRFYAELASTKLVQLLIEFVKLKNYKMSPIDI